MKETVDQAWKASPHMQRLKKKGEDMAEKKAKKKAKKKETTKASVKKPKTLQEDFYQNIETRKLLYSRDGIIGPRRFSGEDKEKKQAAAEAIIKKYPIKG
jgi:hypothetical protein